MSRPRFWKSGAFGSWFKAQPRDSEYAKEIIRKHLVFPDRSLNQLRNLKNPEYDWSNRAWDSLSPQEKRDRLLSLQILREMRKEEKFTPTLKKTGLKREVALKHLGKYLTQSGRIWTATKTDKIQVEMLIYSTKGQRTIITASSKDRSLIGEYFASVQKAVKNNDLSILVKFKDIQIKDAKGEIHRFETDLQALHEIMEAQEEPEFLEIYKH